MEGDICFLLSIFIIHFLILAPRKLFHKYLIRREFVVYNLSKWKLNLRGSLFHYFNSVFSFFFVPAPNNENEKKLNNGFSFWKKKNANGNFLMNNINLKAQDITVNGYWWICNLFHCKWKFSIKVSFLNLNWGKFLKTSWLIGWCVECRGFQKLFQTENRYSTRHLLGKCPFQAPTPIILQQNYPTNFQT